MANKDEIKKAILDVAGNPDTGIIRDMAEAFATAIVELDKPTKEVRVVEAKETR
jgi:hypothetical protein